MRSVVQPFLGFLVLAVSIGLSAATLNAIQKHVISKLAWPNGREPEWLVGPILIVGIGLTALYGYVIASLIFGNSN